MSLNADVQNDLGDQDGLLHSQELEPPSGDQIVIVNTETNTDEKNFENLALDATEYEIWMQEEEADEIKLHKLSDVAQLVMGLESISRGDAERLFAQLREVQGLDEKFSEEVGGHFSAFTTVASKTNLEETQRFFKSELQSCRLVLDAKKTVEAEQTHAKRAVELLKQAVSGVQSAYHCLQGIESDAKRHLTFAQSTKSPYFWKRHVRLQDHQEKVYYSLTDVRHVSFEDYCSLSFFIKHDAFKMRGEEEHVRKALVMFKDLASGALVYHNDPNVDTSLSYCSLKTELEMKDRVAWTYMETLSIYSSTVFSQAAGHLVVLLEKEYERYVAFVEQEGAERPFEIRAVLASNLAKIFVSLEAVRGYWSQVKELAEFFEPYFNDTQVLPVPSDAPKDEVPLFEN